MSKYIDAEAFKRRILYYGTVHEKDRIPIPFYKRYFAEAYVAMLRWVCEEVDDTPTADVVEVKHGRWITKGQDIFCSVCGEESAYTWCGASKFSNYCPNCGSRMDLEGDTE